MRLRASRNRRNQIEFRIDIRTFDGAWPFAATMLCCPHPFAPPPSPAPTF
jgi:hypothetical protein